MTFGYLNITVPKFRLKLAADDERSREGGVGMVKVGWGGVGWDGVECEWWLNFRTTPYFIMHSVLYEQKIVAKTIRMRFSLLFSGDETKNYTH